MSKHSPSVDEVRGFDPGHVSSRTSAIRNALSRPMPGVLHRGEQCPRPAKSAKAVPADAERRVSSTFGSSRTDGPPESLADRSYLSVPTGTHGTAQCS